MLLRRTIVKLQKEKDMYRKRLEILQNNVKTLKKKWIY